MLISETYLEIIDAILILTAAYLAIILLKSNKPKKDTVKSRQSILMASIKKRRELSK